MKLGVKWFARSGLVRPPLAATGVAAGVVLRKPDSGGTNCDLPLESCGPAPRGKRRAAMIPSAGAIRVVAAVAATAMAGVIWAPATSNASGNAGTVDTSFDRGSGTDGTIDSIAVQPDGKMIIAGSFSTVDGLVRHNIARLNSDGQVDAGFDPGDGPDGAVRAVALRSDGSIMIGGDFRTCDGQIRLAIARLDSGGKLDTGFTPVIGVTGNVRSIAVQPDGNTIIAGDFSQYDGAPKGNITRLDSFGDADPGFDGGAGADKPVSAISLQPDGKMLIGGEFKSYDGVPRLRVARLNANGALDSGFGSAKSGADDSVASVIPMPDGGALVGGSFAHVGGSQRRGVARLDSAGLAAPDFSAGVGPNQAVSALASQSDGKIIAVGDFSVFADKSAGGVVRLTPGGALDGSFNAGQPGATGSVTAVGVLADGTALLGGSFTSYDGEAVGGLARVMSDGTPSASFGVGPGTTGQVQTVAVDADGRVLIGGSFEQYDGVDRAEVARLLPNGNLDGSFNSDPGSNGVVHAIAPQSDGKVLVGGDFTAYDHEDAGGLVRLNADGSRDSGFNPGGVGTDGGSVYTIVPLADGKILVGGAITTYDGHHTGALVRLNADGTLDQSFNAGGSGFDDWVNAIAIQSDGGIVVGGWFDQYNGVPRAMVARLHADGTLDTAFDPGPGPDDSVSAIAIRDGGGILIGGDFTHFGPAAAGRLALLDSNGALDATFNASGAGTDKTIHSVVYQSDGRILIGGDFTTFNGTPRGRVARLYGDGSIDSTFDPNGTGADDDVEALALQRDGKILVAGWFGSYDTICHDGIVRLQG